MFFKRPSFKYGGQAEGIKQTVRTNFSAGTNPNKTGSAFVKDIFESQAPTSFNVMNEGIAQGLQMKQPNVAISGGSLDSSYLDSILQPKTTEMTTSDDGFNEMKSFPMKTKTTSADVQSGKARPPIDIFGLEKPLNIGEIFSKLKGKKIVEREKEIQNEEERLAKAIADDVAEENKKFNPDGTVFSPNRLKEIQNAKKQESLKETNIADEFADITLGSAQDEKIANDMQAGELKALASDDPAKALDGEELKLANKEAETGLTGKFIPMFDKYLSPQAAEVKRDAFLAVAKLGFRLMNKPVGEAGLESVEDFEKISREKRQLRALSAMKGLDFEKDIMIEDRKLRIAAIKAGKLDSYDKKALELKKGLQDLYPGVSPTYIDGIAATVRVKGGTYNFSFDKEIYNDASTLLTASMGGQKVVGMNPQPHQYRIAQYAYIDPVLNVNTNLVEIPVDKNGELDKSFKLEPGNFYFSKGLNNGRKVFTFIEKDEMIVGDTTRKSFQEYVSPLPGHKIR